MSDWHDPLTAAAQAAANREKQQAQKRRDAERAERMRAENRMALARRLVNTPPAQQSRAREPVNRIAARLLQKAPIWAKLSEATRLDLVMEPPRIKPEEITDIFRPPPPTRQKQKHGDHRGEQHGVYLILGHAGCRESYEQSPMKFHGGRPVRQGTNPTGLTRDLARWRGRRQSADVRHFWWVRCPDGSVESIEWSDLRRLLPGETTAMMHARKRDEGHCAEAGLELVQNQQQPTKEKGKQMATDERDFGGGRMDRSSSPFPAGAVTATGAPMKADSGIPRDANPEEFFNVHDVAVKVIAQINKEPHQLTALARAAIDARAVLDENMKQIGPLMETFNARVKVALEDVRQSRFAVVGEIAHLVQPLKEVRAFLLGKDYEFEIKRLKEFVELCERLQKLKQDGTLDAIADTIIKLAV
jgi:hypothetical protein